MRSGFLQVLFLAPTVSAVLLPPAVYCQQAANDGQQPPSVQQRNRSIGSAAVVKPIEPQHKRIFWIIPNYRTFPEPANYKPLSTREKFSIATKDSFDRGTVLLSAAFAGQGQLTNANPSFGQGAKGYAHYFATSFADFTIGNYMTEAIYPVLLHQDPRYFRRGTGSTSSRLAYAVSRIFRTRSDSGGWQFNFSELGGNATAAAISNAYYPDNRSASQAASRFGVQIGLDMASNILKEFWPDIHRKLARKHSATQP